MGLYCGYANGSLSISNTRLNNRKTKESTKSYLKLHNRKITHVHLNPVDSNLLATSSNDGFCKIWDVRYLGGKGMNKKKFLLWSCSHMKGVNSGRFSPSTGNSLVTTSKDNTI